MASFRNFLSPLGGYAKAFFLVVIGYMFISACVLATRIAVYIIFNTDSEICTRCYSTVYAVLFAFLSKKSALSCYKNRTPFTGLKNGLIYLLPFLSLSGLTLYVLLCGTGAHIEPVQMIAAISAAIYEELLFRFIPGAYLVKRFENSAASYPGICFMSAFIFGIFHVRNFAFGNISYTIFQIFYTFCLGYLFMAVYLRSGSISAGLIYHIINNLIAYTQISDGGVIPNESIVLRSVRAYSVILLMAAYLIYGYILIRRNKREGIRSIWQGRF